MCAQHHPQDRGASYKPLRDAQEDDACPRVHTVTRASLEPRHISLHLCRSHFRAELHKDERTSAQMSASGQTVHPSIPKVQRCLSQPLKQRTTRLSSALPPACLLSDTGTTVPLLQTKQLHKLGAYTHQGCTRLGEPRQAPEASSFNVSPFVIGKAQSGSSKIK